MLILLQERKFNEGFNGSQANETRPDRFHFKFGHFGDKTKLLENAEIIILSRLGAEISRTFEIRPCDITSCDNGSSSSQSFSWSLDSSESW
ncbi:hypothetical protein AVEN_76305-1 [Araneus ventricosus]|uniref:Uncharacterized protein n=1 Tax=Araneus ventricosus TaxID=182803 RepID=A0A4Y2M3X6_ARAVE|nr:hypothetical protein AVEN_76305-1 [Araneus ventricosus]